MGVGDLQQIQNPLHPPVFPERAVKRVEHDVGARIEGVGDCADVASDIDPRARRTRLPRAPTPRYDR